MWYVCGCISLLCVLFFFFKQKSAYEMRISDGSSDVCSSDLAVLALQAAGAGAHLADREGGGVVDEERQLGQLAAGFEDLVEFLVLDVASAHGVRAHAGALGDDAAGKLLGRHLEREEGQARKSGADGKRVYRRLASRGW